MGTENCYSVPLRGRRRSPIRHLELSENLTQRLRKLYRRIGHLVEPTFEQWEFDFCRDSHPDLECNAWETIADAFEAYMIEDPHADMEMTLWELATISTGSTLQAENARTRRLREVFVSILHGR